MKPDADFIKLLFGDMPDLVVRKDAAKWSKGIFSVGFMRAQENNGSLIGYDIAGKTVYKKQDLLNWAKKYYELEGDLT